MKTINISRTVSPEFEKVMTDIEYFGDVTISFQNGKVANARFTQSVTPNHNHKEVLGYEVVLLKAMK